ncbi:MAG TPA: Matrixin, partial [Bacteroidota bacterium]
MKQLYFVLILLGTILLVGGCSAGAKTAQETKPAGAQSSGASGIKAIKEVVKSSTRYDGLFTLFQDTTDGSVHMLIKKDQIGKQYIYFSFTTNGIVNV